MMSHSFSCVCAIALLSALSAFARPLASIDNTGYSALLSEHVKDGRVNYKAIKNDKRFTDYLQQLSKTDPKTLSGKEELAFWLNVYNAFTLKVMCDHYPLKSITDLNFPSGAGGLIIATIAKSTIWDKQLVEINGKKYSLNGVENDIIRPKGDPRVHFAMVCAAKSCPPLRNEAFQADKLNEQLEDQGRDFLAQTKKNTFDFSKKSCNISNIFNWFKGDFEKTGKTPLQYIARFLPKEQGDMLLANANNFSVNYTEYDWSINE
ncbi:MAG: DUF547 domain-containing protein [Candidatus Kapaibacterium sp.]|nr:MAG: DUF547 domain-containing protein [Candidatus Kapabacteria bacterium]